MVCRQESEWLCEGAVPQTCRPYRPCSSGTTVTCQHFETVSAFIGCTDLSGSLEVQQKKWPSRACSSLFVFFFFAANSSTNSPNVTFCFWFLNDCGFSLLQVDFSICNGKLGVFDDLYSVTDRVYIVSSGSVYPRWHYIYIYRYVYICIEVRVVIYMIYIYICKHCRDLFYISVYCFSDRFSV